MDIRRMLEKVIDTSSFTDKQLQEIWLKWQEKKEATV